ncbi:MAG: EamA family transporter [Gammaproteobacteria bacterium]|nr:EamA family transporter [Gammaproteobacteria bacterium]
MRHTINYRHGILLALATAICLGSITTQAKLFYAQGGNAMTLMLARFIFSTLIFGVLVFLRRQSFQVKQGNRLGVFLVGAVWSGSMIFYLLSVETISVSVAVLVLYTYPLLVIFYALLRGQLPPSLRLLSLFFLAFAGLYLALSGGDNNFQATGLSFAALAGMGAAFTFIKGAKVAPQQSPLVMTFWVNLVGLVMILPMVYPNFVLVTSNSGLIAISIATAFYVIAILCQFQALARLPASTAALILNLEPVISILLAVFILNEQLDYLQWLGIILVISVITISIGSQSRPRKSPGPG